MIYANYDEYEKTNRKAYDKFNKGKIFYAFNLEQLKEGMESIGLNFAKSAFKSELANHEYCYTMDPYDAINALGYTSDEINNDPLLHKALKEAKKNF